MNATQEPKYRIETRIIIPEGVTVTGKSGEEADIDCEARLVNRQSGEPIPDDEPIFILRARDVHAVKVLKAYYRELPFSAKGDHATAVKLRIEQFQDFAGANPARMKEPDTVLTADWPGYEKEVQ